MKVLKGILTVAAFSLFLVACGEKKAEEAVEVAPVEEVAPAAEETTPAADTTAVVAPAAEEVK
jgi:PBP1b-binding outer membrane lipoprotein LpoB